MAETTTKATPEILADLFRRANAAALAADPGPGEDGGTCNMDTPAFRVDRLREAVVLQAAELAGVGVSDFRWFRGQRWYFLHTASEGQASRRTRMMEAAQAVLGGAVGQIDGFRACGYMQAD